MTRPPASQEAGDCNCTPTLRAWLVPWRAQPGSYLHSLSPLPQAKIMQLRFFAFVWFPFQFSRATQQRCLVGQLTRMPALSHVQLACARRTQPARLRGNEVPLRFWRAWPGENFCISWDRPKGACNKPNARAVHQWSQAGGTFRLPITPYYVPLVEL
jgi:hypothetical protein